MKLVSLFFLYCVGVDLVSSFSLEAVLSRNDVTHHFGRFPTTLQSHDDKTSSDIIARRSFINHLSMLSSVLILSQSNSVHADTGAEVRGTAVTPFNALIFQYRGNDYAGLAANEINEPSVPYSEFIDRMKKGEVEFVEFLAPNGDAAYVTFKGSTAPIRIGEGYPVEKADGYSSPAFAIRAVKNAGVPYKFTLPALASSKTTKR